MWCAERSELATESVYMCVWVYFVCMSKLEVVHGICKKDERVLSRLSVNALVFMCVLLSSSQ